MCCSRGAATAVVVMVLVIARAMTVANSRRLAKRSKAAGRWGERLLQEHAAIAYREESV